MMNCSLVRIGKLLYSSSPDYEAAFWRHINDHKKADIVDFQEFKDVHEKDICKVEAMTSQGDLFSH